MFIFLNTETRNYKNQSHSTVMPFHFICPLVFNFALKQRAVCQLFRVLYFFIIVSLFSYCQASHSKTPVICSSLYPERPLTKANLSLFALYAKHLVTCIGPMWGTMWNQNTFQTCSPMNVNIVDKHFPLRTVFKYTDIEFISLNLRIIQSRAFHGLPIWTIWTYFDFLVITWFFCIIAQNLK